MSKLATLKNRAEAYFTEHEAALTCILLAVAAVLILVAIFGKPHHKVLAGLYIVL